MTKNQFLMKNLFVLLLVALVLPLCSNTLSAQEEEFGMASYYHDDFQGRETAYGVAYDKNQLTAAHKKHPFGTILRVTRLDNNRSVNVKVTDKGPFIKGRVVDLSKAAANQLGLVNDGAVEVRVEVVSLPGREGVVSTGKVKVVDAEPVRPAEYGREAAARIETEPTTKPASKTADKPAAKATAVADKEPTTRPEKKTTEATAPNRAKRVGKDYSRYGLYQIEIKRPAQTGYGVQIALLTNYDSVMKEVADLQAKWFDNILVSIEPGEGDKTNYRIVLGPFPEEKTAQKYEQNLSSKYKIKGFTISLKELKYTGK